MPVMPTERNAQGETPESTGKFVVDVVDIAGRSYIPAQKGE